MKVKSKYDKKERTATITVTFMEKEVKGVPVAVIRDELKRQGSCVEDDVYTLIQSYQEED